MENVPIYRLRLLFPVFAIFCNFAAIKAKAMELELSWILQNWNTFLQGQYTLGGVIRAKFDSYFSKSSIKLLNLSVLRSNLSVFPFSILASPRFVCQHLPVAMVPVTMVTVVMVTVLHIQNTNLLIN